MFNNSYFEAWNELRQSSKFAWWEWDFKNNIVHYSDLKAILLGYDPQHFRDRGYQAFMDLVHPEDYERAMDAMRLVLYGSSKLYQIDYRIRTKSGDYKWFMDRGIVIETDGNGRPLKIRGIVINLGKERERGTNVNALISIIYQTAVTDKGRSSFITFCSSCGKTKQGKNNWVDIPKDLTTYLAEQVSHSICPQCIVDLYPDMAEEVMEELNS